MTNQSKSQQIKFCCFFEMVKKKNRVPLLKDLFLVLFLFIPFPFRYYDSRYRPPSVKIICKFHVQFLAFTLLLPLFTWAIGLCCRNLYYLQLRNEFTEGSLSCSKESAVLLASYAAQGNNNYNVTSYWILLFKNVEA